MLWFGVDCSRHLIIIAGQSGIYGSKVCLYNGFHNHDLQPKCWSVQNVDLFKYVDLDCLYNEFHNHDLRPKLDLFKYLELYLHKESARSGLLSWKRDERCRSDDGEHGQQQCSYHLVLIGKAARQDIQVIVLITDQVSLAGNTTNWKQAFFRHCEQFIVSTSVGGWTIAEEEWMLLWCQK